MMPYTLYVSDVSYYSGKLEAFLRYKQIAHQRVCVNIRTLRRVILPATGFIKVPCMRCPDGRWLKDTTPMMAWLDAQHPGHSIYPQDAAQRFLTLLVEDYADEWLWRPAMYYRWSRRDSRKLLRQRLGRELGVGMLYPKTLTGWYMSWRQRWVFMHGDGVRRSNHRHIEAIYHDTLRQLAALLDGRPFLLGQRPSIVDYGFFASMFRHLALDPASAKIMLDTAPDVYAWVGRVWQARATQLAETPMERFDASAWHAVFEQLGRQYLPYLDANATAHANVEKRFDYSVDGVLYPRLPVVRYRVACREQLLHAFRALASQERASVRQSLPDTCGQWLDNAQDIAAGMDREFDMPLAQRYPEARGLYGFKLLAGTPWDLPAEPLAVAKSGLDQRETL